LSHEQINHKHDAEEIQAYNEEERELWGDSMAYPRTLTDEQIADFKRDLYGKSLTEKAKEYGIPPGSLCRYRAKIIKGKLFRSRQTLSCQDNPVARERVRAIDKVLNRYEDETPADKTNIFIHSDANLVINYRAKIESCRKRGIDFDLSFADFKRLKLRKTCYYTGIKMQISDSKQQNYQTIDRIDASKGYSKENCVSCCFLANSLKNILFELPGGSMRMTKTQFRKMADRV
jgi:hypothetical protein